MIFKYGNTQFANCSVEPRISSRENRDQRQTPWSHIVRWDLMIWLMNPGGVQSTMTAMIAAVEAAFAQNFQDIRLLQPDGKASSHQLLNKDTLGGVMVVQPPSYPSAQGAEHVTYRTCTVALEGTVLVNSGSALTEFSEEVTFQGGGPRFGHLEPIAGTPVKQLLKQNTIYRAKQTGRATGILGYPPIPDPIWPAAMVEAPIIVKVAPKRIGNSFTEFTISWSYDYESATPLFGNPSPWLI
jgi:hypothetical protein